MSIEPKSDSKSDIPGLPAWADCDLFCIHDYAGTASAPCGWRGRIEEVSRDVHDLQLRCPRCGSASLFRIPFNRPDGPVE